MYDVNVRIEFWSGVICDVLRVKAASESAARLAAAEEITSKYEKSSIVGLVIVDIIKCA